MDKFKESYLDCIKLCKKISETLLVKIDTRKIFENLEFEEYQVKDLMIGKHFLLKINI